jgi:O-antigen/teichoic acid export membrane protein
VKHRLLKHGIYNTSAGAIRIALALTTVPLLIRFLGLEEYGLWALISAVLGLLTLAEGGLSTTTTVFVAQDLAQDKSDELSQTLTISFSLMIGLASITALIMQFTSTAIVHQLIHLPPMHQQDAIQALQLTGWVVWVRLLQQVFVGIEQAHQEYRLLNILNTCQWIGLSLGLFIIAWQGGHTPELVQWQLLTGLITLLSHAWVVFKLLQHRKLRYLWNQPKAIRLFHQSWMTWVTTLGGALFVRGDRLIVGAQLGTEVLGVYAAIIDVASSINVFSALPIQPILPLLSQYKASNQVNTVGQNLVDQDKTRYLEILEHNTKSQVQQALRLNTFVALSMGFLLFMFTPWTIQLFVGNSFPQQTMTSFQIATLIYSGIALNPVGFYILLGIAVKWAMLLSLASGIFSLGCIIIGLYYGGLLGAIIGNAAYLTTCIMNIGALYKLRLEISLWMRTVFLPLVWFCACCAVGSLTPNEVSIRIMFSMASVLILACWFVCVSRINLKAWLAKCAV